MTRWDVAVVGGINSDFLIRGRELPSPGTSRDGDTFLSAPGGKGANAAVAAARLGARAALIGRVGPDRRGRELLASLVAEGVHTAGVSIDGDSPTGAAVIQVGESGQKQILAALGANLHLGVDDITAAAGIVRASRVLLMQLEVPVACVAAAARIARQAGVRIVLDPAPPRALPEDLISMVHVIRGNAAEIEALAGLPVHDAASARNAARALMARGVEVVIAGLGDGNLLAWQEGDEWLPKLPATPVDVTGAGDAFSGALAAALAERRTLPDAARFASGAAALSTTALGAQTALPRRQELDAYLAAHRVSP